MKILALDSTAKSASVAVLDGERLLGLYNIDNGLTHSELLLPMAESLLKSLKLSIDDIELLAASIGPGSFTGVRIGAALVKGLAFGRDIPCVGVSTLRALAENMRGVRGYIVATMDARRGQTYTATFLCDRNSIKRITDDRAISLTDLACEVSMLDGTIYVVGDGYEQTRRVLSSSGIITETTPPLAVKQSAYSIGAVAYGDYLQGNYSSDRSLNPTYLRMPQAERERLEKLDKESK